MIPEYLYLIMEILEERGEENPFALANDVYAELSEYTKQLYFKGNIEAYKRAIKFALDNKNEGLLMAKSLNNKIIAELRELMDITNTTNKELSSRTSIPESVIETLIVKGDGSVTNLLTLLNYFGRTFKVISLEDHFTIGSPEANYTPITIRPFMSSLFNVLENSLGTDNVPAGIDIGLDITFEDFIIGEEEILQPQGQLSGYDTNLYTSAIFSRGVSLLMTGVVDEKTYDYLIKLHSVYPNNEFLHVGNKYYSLDNVLLSLYKFDNGDTNRYFAIDVPVPMNEDSTAIDFSKRIELSLVINNESFTSYIDFSSINFTPHTAPVI